MNYRIKISHVVWDIKRDRNWFKDEEKKDFWIICYENDTNLIVTENFKIYLNLKHDEVFSIKSIISYFDWIESLFNQIFVDAFKIESLKN